MSSDIANQSSPMWTDEELAAITSVNDLSALVENGEALAIDASQFGTGFVVVDKSELVGRPFYIIGWRFYQGDYSEAVAVMAVVKDTGKKVVFNDGSTGIYKQWKSISAKYPPDRKTVTFVERGLTVSEYMYIDGQGDSRPAKTYYLAL